MKLLSYNIRFGGHGRDGYLAQVIRSVQPDLVIFQEASDPGVILRLAERTEMYHWAARPGYSTAYISRVEIAHHAWYHPRGAKHAFLEVVPTVGDLRIFGLHLSARFSKWSERQRAHEIRALLRGIQQHQDGFHLLVGDFNTLAPGERLQVERMPAWIQALVWISGRDLQRETIGVMLESGYADGYRTLYPDQSGYTFPIWDPHVRLDYVFLPTRYTDRLTECQVLSDAPEVIRASDHFPLLVELAPA